MNIVCGARKLLQGPITGTGSRRRAGSQADCAGDPAGCERLGPSHAPSAAPELLQIWPGTGSPEHRPAAIHDNDNVLQEYKYVC